MARTRNISPMAPKDEDLAELSWPARNAFAHLPCLADCKGRLEDRPKRIKAELLPYDDVDMDGILDELSRDRKFSNGPFIVRYQVDGKRYIQILRFEQYQNPHANEKKQYEKSVAAGRAIPAPQKGLSRSRTRHDQSASLNRPEPKSGPSQSRLILDPRSSIPDPGSFGETEDGFAVSYAPVRFDSDELKLDIQEHWLREQIEEIQEQAGVRLTPEEHDYELEQLRLKLVDDPRLRASVRKKSDGKPSTEAQFKRLATYTAGWFRTAIRRKAARLRQPARASPNSNAARKERSDSAFREVMEETLEEEKRGQ